MSHASLLKIVLKCLWMNDTMTLPSVVNLQMKIVFIGIIKEPNSAAKH